MLRNHQLGFSIDDSGLSFQSWLYVEEDGAIVVVEHYNFLRQRAREEKKPGYSDHLYIPASYYEAFLLLVAQYCQREVKNVCACFLNCSTSLKKSSNWGRLHQLVRVTAHYGVG